MKKLFAILLCICMLLPVLAGCQKEDPVEGKVTITYMSWATGGQKVAEQNAIKAFNASHSDIYVKATFVPGDYLSRLQTLVSGNKEPDICLLHGNYIHDWAAKGLLTDLNPYFETAGLDKSDLLDQAQYNSNGGMYGLATGVGTVLVYYNKQIFADAGITSEMIEGWTWDEYVEILRKVTVDQDGNHPGEDGFNAKKIKTWGTYVPTASYINEPLLWSNGGAYFEADGSGLAVDNPESIEVLQKMVDLTYVERVAPTAAETAGQSSAVKQMQNGQVASFISGVYEMASFHAEGWYGYGVALLPVFDKQVGQVWGEPLVIFESCENKEAAFEFLQYFLDPETNLQLTQDGTQMPSFKSWYTDPEKFAKWTQNECHVEEFRNIIPDFVPNCESTRSIYYIKNSDAVGSVIWNALDQSYLNNMPVATALKGIDDKAKPYLQGAWENIPWLE